MPFISFFPVCCPHCYIPKFLNFLTLKFQLVLFALGQKLFFFLLISGVKRTKATNSYDLMTGVVNPGWLAGCMGVVLGETCGWEEVEGG